MMELGLQGCQKVQHRSTNEERAVANSRATIPNSEYRKLKGTRLPKIVNGAESLTEKLYHMPRHISNIANFSDNSRIHGF